MRKAVRIAAAFTVGLGCGLIVHILTTVALMMYASKAYAHPGSTAGLWAFTRAIPAGVVAFIAGAIWMYRKDPMADIRTSERDPSDSDRR